MIGSPSGGAGIGGGAHTGGAKGPDVGVSPATYYRGWGAPSGKVFRNQSNLTPKPARTPKPTKPQRSLAPARVGRGGGGGRARMAGPGVPLNSPLLNPGASLSGQSLYNTAKALADAQTQGTVSELAHQIAVNNQQAQGAEKLTAGYYNQLGNFVNQSNQQLGSIGAGLNQQLAGINQSEQQQLQGIGQNAAQMMNTYTPGGVQPGGQAGPAMQALTQEIARQQGLAAQGQAGFQSFGATQGANYGSLGASNLGTFALRGQERLGNIIQAANLANEPLQAKIGAAAQTYGADLASALGKVRQQEVTNTLARQGLGIKQQANAIALQRNLANEKIASSRAQTYAQSVANTAAYRQALTKLGYAKLSVTQQNDLANQAIRAAAANAKAGGGTLTKHQQDGLYATIEAMVSGAKYTSGANKGKPVSTTVPALNDAAQELKSNGGITQATWNALRQYGFNPASYGFSIKGTQAQALGTLKTGLF